MKHTLIENPWKSSILVIFAVLIIRLLTNRYKRGICDIPGPLLAKYTRLWKLHSVWKGDHHHTAIDLHKKHGSLVRIGPNHISVGDPNAIPVIYGLNKGFTKTAFFPLQSISWNKRPQMNLFSTRDEHFHRLQKRSVANSYSMTSILELESAVDSCSETLISQLRKFADRKTPVDLGAWLQYYAFDVVGELTFAKKLGFLEGGQDVDGMMEAIRGMLAYASICGQVPEMHPLLLGNPLFPILMPSMESWDKVLQFTLKSMSSRSSIKRDGELQADEKVGGKDMMSKWMALHRSNPEKMSTKDVMVHLSANVFAGSDTTAIALRAVFYLLMRNPHVLAKLQSEIDTAADKGNLGNPISYQESTTYLPYLGAVLKEAMRLHPSTGLIIEREVPKEGAVICGKQIPGGTIVGINAWVVHRDAELYPKPDSFIPERWLDNSPEKLKEMEQGFFNFGSGARTCLGKNVSLMEMYKIVPQLLREFEIQLHDPSKDWKTRNVWFVQQEGMICELVKKI
ncbi:hypothetical protein PENSTE_c039G08490 [Penicillium steckii]|uniref:Cytochrome P450 oxidoreductase n=1 Tax=Penicillium steckii TaxID=303698 RepID=A0A1V6SJ83_9EURO|nr:hypothetical protein PENSTE_c039G08490 [Penicillium steckii]